MFKGPRCRTSLADWVSKSNIVVLRKYSDRNLNLLAQPQTWTMLNVNRIRHLCTLVIVSRGSTWDCWILGTLPWDYRNTGFQTSRVCSIPTHRGFPSMVVLLLTFLGWFYLFHKLRTRIYAEPQHTPLYWSLCPCAPPTTPYIISALYPIASN